MCGIVGYVGLEPGPAGRTVLRRMARQVVHRGPDGEGLVVHGGVGLAHRRLAVIDREGGAQPMRSADGRYLMVYNGEVYNHRELREVLTTAGHTFTTRSDTEVVLAAWAQWGAGALDQFNGMFAMAVLDTTTGEVFLARDQFGIKPLYLAADGSGRVAFASEICPILAAGVVPRRPDDVTVYRYLRFRVHDDTERTFFDRVSRLLPGELAVVSPGGDVRREIYTGLRHQLNWLAARPRPYDTHARAQVAAAVRTAVWRRLVSDVPVGTALSGGLDSSTVVATVNRLLGEQDPQARAVGTVQRAFSAVFPGERDEQRYVDAVAARCANRLDVHKVHPDPDRFLDDLCDFVRTQEEPVISTGPYAQYCVMREAGRHVSVMLDGQGADEVMAGYLPYFLVHLRQLWRRGRLGAAAAALLRGTGPLWRLVRGRLADLLRRRRTVPAVRLLSARFVAAHADERFDVAGDDLKRRLADDVFRHSLPALLRYEDRNTMRFSIEGRVPFLDPDLLRLLWGLDDSAVIGRGRNKRALRDATAGLVPPLVRRRRDTIGFATPEEAWLARMKTFVYEVFSSESFGARPYFDQAAVTAAFRSYLAGTGSAETLLFWRLLNVELWLRELVERDPTVPPASTFTRAHRKPRPASATRAARAARGAHAQAPPKPDWLPNPEKRLVTADGEWARFPLRVDLVREGDNLPALAATRAAGFFAGLPEAPPEAAALARAECWYLFLSEQVVAVAQGRSFHTWQVRPGWRARQLSRFVLRTPYGIGPGAPITMQLAIDEVGLARILAASAFAAAGRAAGRQGRFYRVAGPRMAPIDGPTPHSARPADVSATLVPPDPEEVVRCVSAAVRAAVPPEVAARYGGAVVIDANDLERVVLGHDTGADAATLAGAFVDNPIGQGREQTPLAVVFPAGSAGIGSPAGSAPARSGTAAGHRRISLRRARSRTSSTSRTRSNAARPR